jgi:hypothetical protein
VDSSTVKSGFEIGILPAFRRQRLRSFYNGGCTGKYKFLDYFAARGRKSGVEDLQKNKTIQYISDFGSSMTKLDL